MCLKPSYIHVYYQAETKNLLILDVDDQNAMYDNTLYSLIISDGFRSLQSQELKPTPKYLALFVHSDYKTVHGLKC